MIVVGLAIAWAVAVFLAWAFVYVGTRDEPDDEDDDGWDLFV